MSNTLKSGKQHDLTTTQKDDPFHLPRLIAQQLKRCVQNRQTQVSPDTVPYLWLNLAQQCDKNNHDPRHLLTIEEWLNVVDEAASVGVQFFVICVGESFGDHPEVWKIAKWAQDAHDITVGFHTYAKSLRPVDITEIGNLNADKTWVFVSENAIAARAALEKAGIRFSSSDVEREYPTPPCEGPKSLLFVGSEGVLYCCGLVVGKEDFQLGHVLEKPLAGVIDEPPVARRMPGGIQRHETEHGCDGCPNQMAIRMKKQS